MKNCIVVSKGIHVTFTVVLQRASSTSRPNELNMFKIHEKFKFLYAVLTRLFVLGSKLELYSE